MEVNSMAAIIVLILHIQTGIPQLSAELCSTKSIILSRICVPAGFSQYTPKVIKLLP